MPPYDYECETCGAFREWRNMSQSGERVPCPTCLRPAPQCIAAPMLAVLPRNTRIAHERNERSAHEPKVGRREHLPQDKSHRGHAPPRNPKLAREFGHVQESHSHRPWMVGH